MTTLQRKTMFKAANSRPETFAIRVTGYDTKEAHARGEPGVVKGVRMDTGEEVSVFLRSVEINYTGDNTRPTIVSFAKPRKGDNKNGTDVGGILLVQEAFKQADGAWGARWVQALSHYDGEAYVFRATAYCSPLIQLDAKDDQGRNKQMAAATFLHDDSININFLPPEILDQLRIAQTAKVDSFDELQQLLLGLLNDKLSAGVRVVADDGFDALYVTPKKGATNEQRVGGLMKNLEAHKDAIDAGQVTVEVVPFSSVYAGPATRKNMATQASTKARVACFQGEVEGHGGNPRNVQLYRPAYIAVRLSEPDGDGNRGVYFSHIEPLYTRQPCVGIADAIAYANTAVLSPEAPQPELLGTRKAPASAAPAADSAPPAAGTESFDGDGVLTDDFVGAVSGDLDEPAHPATPAAAPAQAQTPARQAAPARTPAKTGTVAATAFRRPAAAAAK